MMLAETFATGVNWTLICTALMAVGTVGMWIDLRRNPAPKNPQPFEVQATPPGNAEIHLSIRQLNKRMESLENWRSDLTRKLDNDKCEVLSAGEERAQKIYEHIDAVRRELDGKISRVPNETVALLKNTNAI